MSDNATRRTYSRPTKYPASIPRTMTTAAQRDAIDAIRDEHPDSTLGEIVRMLIAEGLDALALKEHERGLADLRDRLRI